MADNEIQKIDDQTIKLYVGGVDPSWDPEKIQKVLGDDGIKRVDVVNNFAFAVSTLFPPSLF